MTQQPRAEGMIAGSLAVFRQQQSAGANQDLANGIALLTRARHGLLGPTLRLYRPEPTVAFGQRDARLPGYPQAALAASAAGCGRREGERRPTIRAAWWWTTSSRSRTP
jgi:hypothetical protein